MLICSFFNFKSGNSVNGIICVLMGILFFICATLFIHTSLFVKAKIWDNIFKSLKINSNDKVLDIGCGHGLVLMKATAKLDLSGHAWVLIYRKIKSNSIIRKKTRKLLLMRKN